ncbi:AfsR/SARP family transcriptional regulator [Nonomuraea endophytica]|uniref:DNA-binding SARP family transcriptional activator n=1 Tax=Nonomuraea endophytica TaxID=714136 RepID=A0A7W8EKA9_9ACTN|nr:transcriptional regulator [Nonomuraea endophytica]MBB5082421.1 DNA-binding SARP family transcriptional activator [Nonomuraea endophytica]
MRILLLGPVGVRTAAGAFVAGPPRRQAVLVMLAAQAPHPVAMTALIEGLWGARAPRSAGQSVYTYVAGLRRVLEPVRGRREPPSVLVGGAGGYQLRLDPHRVDSREFTGLVDEARRLGQHDDHPAALSALDRALGLVRGDPLGGVPGPFAEAERRRLQELQLSASELRADALLKTGRADAAIDSLNGLLAHHPLRERLRELLMLSLYQCGRPAEALEVFADGRRVLADELGVDPGTSLRHCHELILRGDPVPGVAGGSTPAKAPGQRGLAATPDSGGLVEAPVGREIAHESAGSQGGRPVTAGEVGPDGADPQGSRDPVPRQLPRALIGFVGRAGELARLTELVAERGHPLVAISGPPGIGKSALALKLAHAVTDRFPDGQLFVNLRGRTPGVPPLTPLEVLGRFLRALGVPGSAVPVDLDEAAAEWRSRMHGRRVLVILDDAAGLDHVRPLLSPPPGTAMIVTSRETLAASDDCAQVRLEGLLPAEASAMLATLAGAERVAADPAQAERLARLCDGLPLALRISGARLADHPSWSVADLVTRLGDERRRLHELQIGDFAVRSALMSSWSALHDSPHRRDRAAARLLSLLGELHFPEITVEFSAALLGSDTAEAAAALCRLADAHLVERGHAERYHLHDLVRLFAAELRPAGAQAAMVRALAFCVASARHASVLVDPHRVQPVIPPVEAEPAALDSPRQGQEWLVAESANLVSAAKQAMSGQDDEIARLGVALAFSLMWFQSMAYHTIDMLECNELALAVTRRLDDPALAQQAHAYVAGALWMANRLGESAGHHEAALDLARRLGDRFGEQRALGNLANLNLISERYSRTLTFARAQLVIARDIGTPVGIRYAQLMIGNALLGLGRPEEAAEPLAEVLAGAMSDGDAYQEGMAHLVLGETCLALGRPERSLSRFDHAAALLGSVANRIGELRNMVGRTCALRELGRLEEAGELAERAAALAAVLKNPRWEARVRVERHAVREALAVSRTVPPAR